MHISNERKTTRVQLINLIYPLLIVISIFGYVLRDPIFLKYYPYIIAAGILAFIVQKSLGAPFFTYDSDGETLNFYNKKLNFLLSSQVLVKKAEFPKRKLQSFNIKKGLLGRKLELILKSSSKDSLVKIKYDISYLNKKDIRDLKQSLQKVISQNEVEE